MPPDAYTAHVEHHQRPPWLFPTAIGGGDYQPGQWLRGSFARSFMQCNTFSHAPSPIIRHRSGRQHIRVCVWVLLGYSFDLLPASCQQDSLFVNEYMAFYCATWFLWLVQAPFAHRALLRTALHSMEWFLLS